MTLVDYAAVIIPPTAKETGTISSPSRGPATTGPKLQETTRW